MPATITKGWLCVPYTGPENAVVQFQLNGDNFIDAYLDYEDGIRVAKIRPPDMRLARGNRVTVLVDGQPYSTEQYHG